MKVLVVGGGGREHALCWTLAASPLCHKLYCAPGNAGIAEDAECVAIAADDIEGILAFVKQEAIDYVVVGPEAPLVLGLVDRLNALGVKAFGPSAAAAQLEGSKGFTKDLCAKYDIPTAAYGRFTDPEAAKAYVREQGAPIVVKADGLAAGKGVTVAMTEAEALAAIDEAMAGGAFGEAGAELVIEAFLEGEEASFFALVDGETALPLATAQDHKRAYDGDEGPNTGGMGAYSPAPVMTQALIDQTMDKIIRPTVAAMKAEGHPFKGVLYAGLMITDEGPELIEYNVRFGDPECQVVLMRLMSDLLPALIACTDGVLSSFDLRWYEEAALSVVMAAKGYPGSYEKGTEIRGLETAGGNSDDVKIFHAGTKPGEDGAVLANGGRVLNVTAMAPTIKEAQARAYIAVDKIDWPEGFCRRDIGWRAVGRDDSGMTRDVPTLTTERLVLRGHRKDDFENCAALWSDPEVVRYITGKPSTPSESWGRLLNYTGHWALLGYGFWAVEERASGRYVGEVGLADFKRDIEPGFGGSPEAGWVLAPWAHGKGYATEAVQAALAWGERELTMTRCVCMIDPDHGASRRVAAKCGFTVFAETTFKEGPVILLERLA